MPLEHVGLTYKTLFADVVVAINNPRPLAQVNPLMFNVGKPVDEALHVIPFELVYTVKPFCVIATNLACSGDHTSLGVAPVVDVLIGLRFQLIPS